MQETTGWADSFVHAAKRLLPSPFTIAIFLTIITYVLAVWLTQPADTATFAYAWDVVGFWEQGFWELLTFTMQMMLILVLGHTLALTKPANILIKQLVKVCDSTPKAAFIITFTTIIVALFNWGLGLIFGAVFARKIGEHAKQKGIKLNYALIGAAAYSGLMVWHGGMSGSAPLAVAGAGHQLENEIGIITTTSTLFSSMNLVAAGTCLLVLPLLMFAVARVTGPTEIHIPKPVKRPKKDTNEGAERLDTQNWLGIGIGLVFISYSAYKAFIDPTGGFQFLTLNNINFLLFGLGILFHGNFRSFIRAFEEAIRGASGIMLQFPLYAGIIGIMKYSGLLHLYADFFIGISNQTTFPLFTFISAGIINVFVPSGGGQWAVQGPIIAEAANSLGIPMAKNVMALAYGDQLTNMLQPFWALPLLGITGLKAQEILPYTFLLFVAGFIIFGSILLIF